ncbi:MAG: hypothetical protein EOP35_01675 [Rubrivivax sp.]|nr:MAG: hypothetical protein EOP35_01675 [Rubrivivax sp.]
MNHRAPLLPDSGLWIAPQGRPAWPARRCSPEVQPFGGCDCSAGKTACDCIQPAPAEACTELGADSAQLKKQPLSVGEAYLLMVIYMLSCCIAVSVLCLISDALQVAAR